jgi:hypothetical protein
MRKEPGTKMLTEKQRLEFRLLMKAYMQQIAANPGEQNTIIAGLFALELWIDQQIDRAVADYANKVLSLNSKLKIT